MKTLSITAAIFLLSALMSFSRCSQNRSQKQLSSGIEGQVLLGPMSAVVRADRPMPDKPYKADLKILSPEREEITQLQTDDEGKFKIVLEPGEYIISPVAPNPIRPPYPEEQTVTVKANQFTSVIVHFDTGIR
jgi:hypothetical protein